MKLIEGATTVPSQQEDDQMEILAAVTTRDLDLEDLVYLMDSLKGKEYQTCCIADLDDEYFAVAHTGDRVPTATELHIYLRS